MGTEEEWQALCRATGHPEWLADDRFADSASRRQNQDELDKLITSWTVQHYAVEATELLQIAGVAAAPSLGSEELYADPHLKERGYWMEIDHPVIGKQTVVAPPWKLSETPADILRPSPLLGEHNGYVFEELLGLSPAEIEQLVAEQVIY